MAESDSAYTVEQHFEIWHDKKGECLKVGPDRDALELVEITKVLADGKEESRIVLTKEEARLLMRVLEKVTAS
jgi:hypothetical protein